MKVLITTERLCCDYAFPQAGCFAISILRSMMVEKSGVNLVDTQVIIDGYLVDRYHWCRYDSLVEFCDRNKTPRSLKKPPIPRYRSIDYRSIDDEWWSL